MGYARSGSSLEKVVGALEGMGARGGIARARIADVAQAAGVSPTTASRCLAELQQAGSLEVVGSFGREKRLALTGSIPAPPPAKPAGPSEGQERVLEALRQMGAEDGPVGVSTAELARGARVSTTTVVKSVEFWAHEGALEVERVLDETGRILPNTYRIVRKKT